MKNGEVVLMSNLVLVRKTPVGEIPEEVVAVGVKGSKCVFVLDCGDYFFETFDGRSGTMYSKVNGYEELEKVIVDLESRGYKVRRC